MDTNLDIPEIIDYMATLVTIRDTDAGIKNWYVARDTQGTGRWQIWPWDLNWTFTTPAEDGDGTFLTPQSSNKLYAAMLAYPDYSAMYYRRLRTVADQFLAPGRYEAQWDAIAQTYTADWALETAKWGLRSSDFARQKFIQGLTDRRNLISANTGPGKPIPPSQSASPDVVINEIQYQPVGGDNQEFVELTNRTTESVDLSGWTIDSIGLTVPGGTVLLPGAQVVFVANDVAFRAAYGGARFVGGVFSGHLSNTGQTLTLRHGTQVVDEVTYSPDAPWPTQAAGGGPSLELGAPGLDNAMPENWFPSSTIGGSPGAVNPIVLPNDTVAPSAPGTLTSSGVTAPGISLSWGPATDARGVTAYNILRNGAVLATVGGLTYTYTDASIAASTAYSYTVVAVDGAANIGPATNTVTETPPPGYQVALFADSFTGTDGAGWSPAWIAGSANGGTTLQSNAARIGFNDVTDASASAQLGGLAARADSEVKFSYQWNATSPTAYFNIYLRGSGGWQNPYRPRNGYGLELTSSSTTVAVRKNVNGAVSTIRSVAGQTVTTAKQWVRLRVVGSTIQFKIWRDGSAEPATWTSTDTDASVTAPGQLFLSLVRGGGNSGVKNVTIDDLTVTSGGTVAPPPDTTPPTTPTGLTSSNVGQTQATVSWNASTDNVGVTGYRVSRNGTDLPTIAGTSFTDTALLPGTTYSYTVRAVDAAGLASAPSTALAVTTATPPVGTTLFSDGFTGTDGSAWGPTWATSTGAGTTDLQSSSGRLAFNDTSGAFARAQLSGVAARADSSVLMSYRWNAATTGAYFSVNLRGSGGWANAYRPRSGYGIQFASGSTTAYVIKTDNGSVSTIATVGGAALATTAKQWVRFRVVGSTIQFRTWADGATEPSTWRSTVTDAGVTTPGQLFVSIARSSTNTGAKSVSIDDLVLGDGS